ncbi:hypothetical protein ACJA23_02915 [Mycoplasma corogypsi]|uniref:hypothetical protein n=1 Tax=Mycoplasma corogypsi TaxID=2106 RepID=UPI0038739B42
MKNKKHFNKWLISGATLTPLVLVAASRNPIADGINDPNPFGNLRKSKTFLKSNMSFKNKDQLENYLDTPQIKEVLNINFGANTYAEAKSNNNDDNEYNAYTIIKKMNKWSSK